LACVLIAIFTRTNYLAVNVNYVSPTTELPTTSTLAVVDTNSRHTARELKEMIVKILNNYSVPLDNILCCITDNATNMVKLVSSMSQVMVPELFLRIPGNK